MKNNYYCYSVLKKCFFKASGLLFALTVLSVSQNGYSQELSNKAKNPVNWAKGGIYEGYNPDQEILAKRSKSTKHFKNADGSITAQIGSSIHYEDQNGKWQDVDFSIIANDNSALGLGYKFSNLTNEVKSYFPENSGSKSVLMKIGNDATLSWWKNPKMNLTVNGQTVQSFSISQKAAIVETNKIIYKNAYPGMSEEFEVISGGLENNIIINSLSNQILNLPSSGKVEFSQIIELDNSWNVYTEKSIAKSDFTSKKIFIEIPGSEGVTFNSIFVFDNKVSKEEALYIISIPMEKLTAAQKRKLENNIFQCDYKAEFVDGGLKISTVIPVSWLKNSNRQFPVTVDPVVTIGNGATGTDNPYGPIVHLWGYERYANLYLQSEVGAYGTISAIEYYKKGTQAARTKPTKVYMRTTAATALTGTDAWDSTTYTGGLTPLLDATTTQDNTAGWKMLTLPTGFGYGTDNLLIMVKADYGGSGSSQYMSRASGTGRQAYIRADTTDPAETASTGVEGYRPDIRITYTSVPPVITSFTPTSGCSSTATVVITGTDLLGITSLTIGGTPVASYVIDSSTQVTAVVGNGTTGPIVLTSSLGSTTSSTDFTVNDSPTVEAITGESSVCVGSEVPFTNSTADGTWAVVNGTGSGTISASGVFTGETSGSVTITYTVTNTACSTVVTKNVTIEDLPESVSISPTSQQLCQGDIETLTVTGASSTANAVFGTGTTAPLGTAHPNPFNSWYGGSKVQMLYLKSEIEAQGVLPGSSINSIVFDFFASVASACNDLKIRIGATTNETTTATSFVPLSSLTTVYSGNYTPVSGASGPVTFTFTSPFIWDGTSNLIIEVLHNQGNGGNGNGTRTKTTTTSFNSVWYGVKDNITPAGATSFDALTAADFTTGTSGRGVSTLRPNVIFEFTFQNDVVWTPATGLFTDAEATIPYTSGTNAVTVYAQPASATTYSATVTNAAGCWVSLDSNLTMNPESDLPEATSPQNFTAGQTLADLVVTGTNLIWYEDATGTIVLPDNTPLEEGITYYVSQTEIGACESGLLPITVEDLLSNPSFDTAKFQVYPNPVKNFLNLSYSQEMSDVAIFNLLGQQVLSKKINATESQIDMSSLSQGTYLVKVTVDNQVKTIKVVKE